MKITKHKPTHVHAHTFTLTPMESTTLTVYISAKQTFSYMMLIKCHKDRKTIIAISKLFRWLFQTLLPTQENMYPKAF